MSYCLTLPSRTASVLLAAAALLLPAVPAAIARAAAPADTATAKPASYEQEIAAWHKERIDGLKRPDGWLSLVGLFWLHEGENRFGSSAANTVIFPEGSAPAVAGTLTRQGKTVTVHAAPGVALTQDGKPVTDFDLTPKKGGPPLELALGSLRFFVIYRGDRVGIRVKDEQSPALASFKDVDTFPVQPAWRFDARFEPYNPPKKIAVTNILGQVEDNDSPGAVVFERGGQTYRLEAIDGGPDGLFLVFGDLTNGHETYGAGRFLDTPPPKDGKVVVDFNRAYNPPCAFTAFATCPLPPRQNKLAVKVEAGEKKYGEGHPHE